MYSQTRENIERVKRENEQAEKEEAAIRLINRYLDENGNDKEGLTQDLRISWEDYYQQLKVLRRDPEQWRENMISRAVYFWEDKINQHIVERS